MDWLKLLTALIGIIGALTSYFERRGIVDSETAKLLKDNYEDALLKIRQARLASADLPSDAASVRADPDNRIVPRIEQDNASLRDGH